MVNNAPLQAWLKIIKVDQDGQKISLSHATFKLKDSQGNYVKQKVGMIYKDEWTTDEKGYVVLDNMLEAGEYTIEELKTPEGFLIGDDIKVNISSDNKDIIFDEDHQPVIEVSFVDEKPTGHLILHKEFEREEDTAVGGAQFKVTADSDIVNPATGKMIYHTGDIVSIGNATDGIYMIDESGKLELTGLPLGITGARYKVEEISTVDGYVLLDEPVIFEFDIKDNTTKEYTVEKTIENKLTETYFSKQDLNGTELKGGEYSVIDAESDEIIEQWTSDGRTHLIKGLVIGKDYIYREDLTPLGYTYAKDVKFTMSENKQTIVMKDTQVAINKLDESGNVVKGAILQIVDDQKNVINQWTTDGSVHYAEGLQVGEIYMIVEIKTPEGYKTAPSVTFTVDGEQDLSITMTDHRILTDILVNKIDSKTHQNIMHNDFEFTIYSDVKCQNPLKTVKADTTKGTAVFEDLEYGQTVYVKETKAPLGYQLSDEVVKIVIDDQLEGIGDVYSIEYENTRMPVKVVQTDDNTAMMDAFVFVGGSSLLIAVMAYRMKKKKDE